MKLPDQLLGFASAQEWRAWLEEHHATEREAWLLHNKKGASKCYLGYEEAVEEALCFGWIDGLLKTVDGERYALRYSPRKKGSVWAESNKQRVAKLIAAGRMTPAGLAKVAEAQASGEWEAASAREDVSTLPADLAQALASSGAAGAFEQWTVSRKKQVLFWLASAKRPETRRKRIRAIVDMAQAGR